MSNDVVVGTEHGPIATRDFGGSGAPILYIHGQGMNMASWDSVAAAVGDGFCQVAIDLPAHGDSYDIDEWRWDEVADGIDAIVAHHALDRPVVVGHSLGGFVAMKYAAARGLAYVRGIINVDGWVGKPFPDIETPEIRWAREQQIAKMDSVALPFETLMTMQRNAVVAQGIRWDAAEAVVHRQFVVDDNGIARLRKSADQTRRVMEALLPYDKIDLWDALGRLECPMHFVSASSVGAPPSLPVPPRFDEDFHEARKELVEWMPTVNPRVTAEFLPCGHNIPIILPEALAAIVARQAATLASA